MTCPWGVPGRGITAAKGQGPGLSSLGLTLAVSLSWRSFLPSMGSLRPRDAQSQGRAVSLVLRTSANGTNHPEAKASSVPQFPHLLHECRVSSSLYSPWCNILTAPLPGPGTCWAPRRCPGGGQQGHLASGFLLPSVLATTASRHN
jgi:hypothetical protein